MRVESRGSQLILIHEAGHLVAAELVGIPVAAFSVGLGSKVWGVVKAGRSRISSPACRSWRCSTRRRAGCPSKRPWSG